MVEGATLQTIVTAPLDSRLTRLRRGSTGRDAAGESIGTGAGFGQRLGSRRGENGLPNLLGRNRVIAWTRLHSLLSGDTRHCAGKPWDIAASPAVETGFTVGASASIESTGQGPFGGAGNTVQRARPAVSTAGVASEGERNDGAADTLKQPRL